VLHEVFGAGYCPRGAKKGQSGHTWTISGCRF
jgi:hypothetical protein